jgi:FkbM family methyltransferase
MLAMTVRSPVPRQAVSVLKDWLYSYPRIGKILHALRLLQWRAVLPVGRYALALVFGRPHAGRYTSRRTGQTIFVRPRVDLQIMRELVSSDIYSPPPEVVRQLGSRARFALLDLGANIGLSTLNAFHAYGDRVTVTALEPDPRNLELLHKTLAANGLDERVRVIEAAVGTADGIAEFAGGLAELSQLSEFHDLRLEKRRHERFPVRVVDFFSVAAAHDLVKMDVEGAEWAILQDPRLQDLDALAIVLEWHIEGSPSPPNSAAEAERFLSLAGFDQVRHLAPNGTPLQGRPSAGGPAASLWAWRRKEA